MKNKRNVILILLLCFNFYFTEAQAIMRASIGTFGSSNQAGEVFLQHAAGQPTLVGNEKNENIGLRQGFIQPIQFIEEQNELDVTLFPNPNQGVFSFTVNQETNESFSYLLFDQKGKLLLQSEAPSNQLIPISIENPTTGMYHLKVSSGSRFSSFKINVIH